MKEIVFKITAIMLILTGSLVSCGEEKEPTEIPFTEPVEIPFTEYSLVDANCGWTSRWNISVDNVIVVNSKTELKKYVTCMDDNYPEIDFTKNTLLLAHGSTSNGVAGITPSFYQNSANQYTLNVKVLLDFTMVAQGWSIYIVVSKLPEKAKINLNVQQSH
jgi:hypothetical protein